VPWCTDCDRFLSPSTVNPDGTCPTCGRAVERGGAATRTEVTEDPLPPIPWHLKILAGGVAVYLGYRLYQGILWIVG
jgi:hypothetical protein